MASTGGTTPHTAATSGSFGGTVNAINGGLECVDPVLHESSIVSRIDKYCAAANELGVGLLSFGGCTKLQDVYDGCLSTGSGTFKCTACDGITTSPTQSEFAAVFTVCALYHFLFES